jgi:hypothetical protein
MENREAENDLAGYIRTRYEPDVEIWGPQKIRNRERESLKEGGRGTVRNHD